MKWYAVKVLFTLQIHGAPEETRLDAHYHDDDFYEEQVLLIQGESGQEAADKAEALCREKNQEYVNRYGQIVRSLYYDWLEVDEIRDFPLQSGTVALSSTYRMKKGADVEALIDGRYSPCDRDELFPLHNLNAGL